MITLKRLNDEEFLLNSDLIEFTYSETPINDWPDYQLDRLAIDIMRIRRILPKGVDILNSYSFGYKLEIRGD